MHLLIIYILNHLTDPNTRNNSTECVPQTIKHLLKLPLIANAVLVYLPQQSKSLVRKIIYVAT